MAAAPRSGASARKGREVGVRGWDGNCGTGSGYRRENEGRGEGSDRESLGGGRWKRSRLEGWYGTGKGRQRERREAAPGLRRGASVGERAWG